MSTPPTLHGLDSLPSWLAERGVRRALLVTGPARRFVHALSLDGLHVEVFDGAQVHVPRVVVERATGALDRAQADTVITLGGGAATGLGKALCLDRELRFVAIPTTYSGSEQTNIYGIRDEGNKTTGRDERVRPEVVVHAPELFAGMPKRLTVNSLLNALAHPISALSTGKLDEARRRDALRAIEEVVAALDQLVDSPTSAEGRQRALSGATLAARVLDAGAIGAHHRHAHDVGGRFALDHAGLHSVLLPHTVYALSVEQPALYAEIAAAAGFADLPATLYDLLTRAGAPRSLIDLGVPADAKLSEALRDALHGRRPSVHTPDAGGTSESGSA